MTTWLLSRPGVSLAQVSADGEWSIAHVSHQVFVVFHEGREVARVASLLAAFRWVEEYVAWTE